MISLNPFKKKEDDGFKLDEYSLPSLGENPVSQEQTSSSLSNSISSISPLPDSSSPLPSLNSSSLPALDSSSDQQQGTPGISSPLPSSFDSKPIESHVEEVQDTSSFHNDLTKAKLETIATKLELMEARQHAMDQKVEQIYQMIAMEVSPETKKRLKIKSMMDNLREN